MATEVQVAVAKVNRWAMSESGDTFEMVERPHGVHRRAILLHPPGDDGHVLVRLRREIATGHWADAEQVVQRVADLGMPDVLPIGPAE